MSFYWAEQEKRQRRSVHAGNLDFNFSVISPFWPVEIVVICLCFCLWVVSQCLVSFIPGLQLTLEIQFSSFNFIKSQIHFRAALSQESDSQLVVPVFQDNSALGLSAIINIELVVFKHSKGLNEESPERWLDGFQNNQLVFANEHALRALNQNIKVVDNESLIFHLYQLVQAAQGLGHYLVSLLVLLVELCASLEKGRLHVLNSAS